MDSLSSDPLPRAALEYAERIRFDAGTDPPGSVELQRLFDIATDAFDDLYGRLHPVIGPSGCEVLFRRSFRQTTARHPILKDLEPNRSAEEFLDDLRKQARPEHTEDIATALRQLMAEHVALLTRLIGGDLVRTILEVGEEPGREPRPGDEPG